MFWTGDNFPSPGQDMHKKQSNETCADLQGFGLPRLSKKLALTGRILPCPKHVFVKLNKSLTNKNNIIVSRQLREAGAETAFWKAGSTATAQQALAFWHYMIFIDFFEHGRTCFGLGRLIHSPGRFVKPRQSKTLQVSASSVRFVFLAHAMDSGGIPLSKTVFFQIQNRLEN